MTTGASFSEEIKSFNINILQLNGTFYFSLSCFNCEIAILQLPNNFTYRKDYFMLSSIKEKINTEFIGKNILYYDTTDSTNLEAKRKSTEPNGTVFIANHQSKGRGRLSREWSSEDSSGIYMSILLKPTLLTDYTYSRACNHLCTK